MSIYMYSNKHIRKTCEINPSRISAPSPKPRKYLYAKIMAYTVLKRVNQQQEIHVSKIVWRQTSMYNV